jgi:CRP-like cAMP-binding protein
LLAMKKAPNHAYCTDATWVGRSDCVHCDVRGTMLFSTLSEVELASVLQPIDNLQLPAKAVLYREGGTGDSVYTIRRGLVRLVHYAPNGTRRIVRLLGAGDVTGLEVLVNSHYHHTPEAVTATDVCRIPAAVVSRLEEHNPALHRALMARWQSSVDKADTVITELSTGTAHARAARFLLRAACDDGRTECHHLSREDIAALLGLTVETVSRVFAEFKRSGWLREDARRFQIDPAELGRIASAG